MTVEVASYISQLNPSYPAAGDPKSEGDDHLRLTKTVLQTQFPNLGATAVTATAAELNAATGNIALKANKAGDTYTGTHDFTGAVINVPTQSASDNDTSAASTAMVQAAILASSGITASLPAQTGNSGKFLTTNGTSASWGAPPGLVLLATLTPTAAANVDFLSTFTSSYDNYLILIEGILPASNDVLRLRLATAGAADSGSNYIALAVNNTSSAAVTSIPIAIGGSGVLSGGKGCSAVIHITNANDATNCKTVHADAVYQQVTTSLYAQTLNYATYTAANTVSGFRLYWNGGTNFSAVGSVRVYGYSNT